MSSGQNSLDTVHQAFNKDLLIMSCDHGSHEALAITGPQTASRFPIPKAASAKVQ